MTGDDSYLRTPCRSCVSPCAWRLLRRAAGPGRCRLYRSAPGPDDRNCAQSATRTSLTAPVSAALGPQAAPQGGPLPARTNRRPPPRTPCPCPRGAAEAAGREGVLRRRVSWHAPGHDRENRVRRPPMSATTGATPPGLPTPCSTTPCNSIDSRRTEPFHATGSPTRTTLPPATARSEGPRGPALSRQGSGTHPRRALRPRHCPAA